MKSMYDTDTTKYSIEVEKVERISIENLSNAFVSYCERTQDLDVESIAEFLGMKDRLTKSD